MTSNTRGFHLVTVIIMPLPYFFLFQTNVYVRYDIMRAIGHKEPALARRTTVSIIMLLPIMLMNCNGRRKLYGCSDNQ